MPLQRVLLFGSLIPPGVVAANPDVNEAGNRYQLDLCRSLRRAGVGHVTAISALSIATAPRPRRLVVRKAAWDLGDGIDILAPGFVNLLPFKPISVHARLKAAGKALQAPFDVVMAFSPTPIGHASAGLAVARQADVPFVCITADYVPDLRPKSPLRAMEQRLATRIVRASDGLVVVSGHVPRDMATSQPWMKLDGGVADDWLAMPRVPPRAKTVVFAGTPDRIRGTRLLLDAFALVDDPDMRLVFAGRGGLADEIEAATALDPRITLAGFLSRAELQALLASATVLVNPRLSSAPENRYNFPAKLLDYLASGRPTITTSAGDLDPAYERVSIPLGSETPEALAALLLEVCGRPDEALADIGAAGRAFVLAERSWDHQAVRIVEFLEGLSPSSHRP